MHRGLDLHNSLLYVGIVVLHQNSFWRFQLQNHHHFKVQPCGSIFLNNFLLLLLFSDSPFRKWKLLLYSTHISSSFLSWSIDGASSSAHGKLKLSQIVQFLVTKKSHRSRIFFLKKCYYCCNQNLGEFSLHCFFYFEPIMQP